jgi:hypothetical protein
MPKHPPLTLVSPATTSIAPPRNLGPHGLNLWNRIQHEYRVDDAGGVEILAQACAGLDRAEELKACIDADGAVVRVRGIPRAHPACKDEIAARAFVVRTLQRLGLSFEAIKSPGGQPRPYGWTGEQ